MIKTWKTSTAPDYETKKNRVLELSTKKDQRVGNWAAENNVELAYVPTNASWLNRIECQFTALRFFTLDGTDHGSHKEQNSMIRRYIAWRTRHKASIVAVTRLKRPLVPTQVTLRASASRHGHPANARRGRDRASTPGSTPPP